MIDHPGSCCASCSQPCSQTSRSRSRGFKGAGDGSARWAGAATRRAMPPSRRWTGLARRFAGGWLLKATRALKAAGPLFSEIAAHPKSV